MRTFLYHCATRVLFCEPDYAETVYEVAKSMAGIEYRLVDDDADIDRFTWPHITLRNRLVDAPQSILDDHTLSRFQEVADLAKSVDERVYAEKERVRLEAAGLSEHDFPVVFNSKPAN